MNDTTIAGKPTPTKHALDEKGILLCYNQFTPHYPNFQALIKELPEIAGLGYNAVWLAPVHPVSQHPKEGSGRKGSIYAAVDLDRWRGDFFGTDDVDKQKELLKRYTRTARSLGLVPMFDLVLNHMGRTSPEAPNLVECGTDAKLNKRIKKGEGENARNISTRFWFRRDNNEGLILSGVETDKPFPDYLIIDGRHMDMWDDIAMFDYGNPREPDRHTDEKRRQIIKHLWKPYIDKYVGELGFEGMRIDAAQKVHPDVLKEVIARAAEICAKRRRKDPVNYREAPVVLAETLGEVTERQREDMQGCGITHVINGSFWAPLKHDPNNWSMDLKTFAEKWDDFMQGLNKARYEMRWIVRYKPDGSPQDNKYPNKKGGDVGLQESHDHHSRANTWKFDNDTDREQALREALVTSAFYAGAGSIACTGMHEADDRHRNVFINENEPKKGEVSIR